MVVGGGVDPQAARRNAAISFFTQRAYQVRRPLPSATWPRHLGCPGCVTSLDAALAAGATDTLGDLAAVEAPLLRSYFTWAN